MVFLKLLDNDIRHFPLDVLKLILIDFIYFPLNSF